MSDNFATTASEFVAVPFGETCWRQLMPEFEAVTTDVQAQSMLAPYDAVRLAAYGDFIFIIGHRPPPASAESSAAGQWSQASSLASALKNTHANARSNKRQSLGALPLPTPLLDNLMRFCLRTLTWSKQTTTGDAPPNRLTNYAFSYDASSGKAYLHGGYLGRAYYNSSCLPSYVDESEGQVSSEIYELDLATLTWRRLLPLPVIAENKPHEFNGAKDALKGTTDTAEQQSKGEAAVTMSPVKPVARFSHSMCVHEQKLYIFGGISVPAQTEPNGARNINLACDVNMPKLHNDVFSYDLNTCTWERVTTNGSPPAARQAHASDLYRRYGRPTRMIIHGGSTPHHMLNDIFSLDLKTFQWREMKRDTLAAQAAIIRSKNNNDNNTTAASASVHVLAPVGKSRHRITVIGCKMFVMGGIRVKTHAELDADLRRSSMDDIDRMTRYVPVNELAVFDFEKRIWSVYTPATYARSRLPAIISPPSELVTTNAPAGGTAVSFAAGGDNGQVVIVTEPKKRQYSEANKWPLCEDFSHIPCLDLTQHNFRLYATCGPELSKHFFQADIGRPPAPPQLRYLSITYDNVEIEWNAVPNADEYLIQLQLLAIEDSSPLYHKVASSSLTTPHPHQPPYGATAQQQRVVMPPAAGLFPHNLPMSHSNSVATEDKPSATWSSNAGGLGFPPLGPDAGNQFHAAARTTVPSMPARAASLPQQNQQPHGVHNFTTNIPSYLLPKHDIELVDADSCIGLAMTSDNHMQSIDDSIAYAQLTTPAMPVASFNLPTRSASAWFDVAIVDRMSNTFVVDSYLVPTDVQSRNMPPFTEHVPDYRTGTVLTRVYGLYGISTLSLTRLFQNLMVKLRVCAINGCGRSIFSNEVQIKTYLRGLPPPPENVQVKWTNDSGCSISWKEVTENGPIKDYTVFLMQKIPTDSTGKTDEGPTAVVVYEGSRMSAVIHNDQLARAYIETINGEPAITFRVSSRNEALLGGQAVQVRWLYRSPARGSPSAGGGGVSLAPPWVNAGIGLSGGGSAASSPSPARHSASRKPQPRSLLAPSPSFNSRTSLQLPPPNDHQQPVFPRTFAHASSPLSTMPTPTANQEDRYAASKQLVSSEVGSGADYVRSPQHTARNSSIFAKRMPTGNKNPPSTPPVTGLARPTVSFVPATLSEATASRSIKTDGGPEAAAGVDKKKKASTARSTAKNTGAPVGLEFSDLSKM